MQELDSPGGGAPAFAALVAGRGRAALAEPSGAVRLLSAEEAEARLAEDPPPLVCHAPSTARRLGLAKVAALDLLELFAFARPARFCLPTPRGLAAALELGAGNGPGAASGSIEAEARLLPRAAAALLEELALEEDAASRRRAAALARAMGAGGWPWAPHVLRALGGREPPGDPLAALLAWRKLLSDWPEFPPGRKPGNHGVSDGDARRRLAQLTGPGAEDRPQQSDYASAVAQAFGRRDPGAPPATVLAEAGTGIGKTFGYIAPASLWAEANDGIVWISTYTRNLQRQIDDELDQLHPDPETKNDRVVIRKGRENYLCLLKLEEAASRRGRADAAALGLVARWVEATRDGDLGGDFPAWLPDLAGRAGILDLADRRGECVYSACPHYRKCFVEKTVRRARSADIVVANHALVLSRVAAGDADDPQAPTRLVFDEGHHLFDAADDAFATVLSGRECAELRRWLLGPEGGGAGRSMNGLRHRLEDVAADDARIGDAVREVYEAARILPAPDWIARVVGGAGSGPAEAFLREARRYVLANAAGKDQGYDLEAPAGVPDAALLAAGRAFSGALDLLARPMAELANRLAGAQRDRGGEPDAQARHRIDAVERQLKRRIDGQLEAWRAMLAALEDGAPAEFVDWLSVARRQGRDVDIGLHRHWLDPSLPFARGVIEASEGTVITSATLTGAVGDAEADWRVAEARTGAAHLEAPATRARVPSPFDYPAQTRVLVVTDVRREDAARIAEACFALFRAAGGGGLALFTAIRRLREVHARLAPRMEESGRVLLAQHVDGMDNASLVDIFRAEENSCLLGTDAMRDGVDVPGRSLRLVVLDRVPWQVPTILHRARRGAFQHFDYDDLLVRLRLKQAYGRLVRRAADRGVFVVLDTRLSSRFSDAFPAGVRIERATLAEAAGLVRGFLPGGEAATRDSP